MLFNREQIQNGMIVRSADGDKLGKVIACDDSGLILEKGIFFPKDYKASFDQIDSISEDEIYLKFGTDLVQERYDNLYGSGSYANETSDQSMWTDYDRSSEAPREHLSMPLKEERLDVQKTGLKEKGRVRIFKTVRTEDQTFTVPLKREEVHIERVPGGEETTTEMSGEGAFEEKTIDIPVREEELDVKKRTVVKERLKVSKSSDTVQAPVSGEVRKEEAHVEREGDLESDEDLNKKKAI